MKFGKLSSDELKKHVLSKLRVTRKEILLSAAVGEDCAALKTDDILLISSDPITGPVEKEKIGALAVDVCCNDITANGGEPLAMTLTLILPQSFCAEDAGIIMDGAALRAKNIGIDIIGGHTEFSDSVTRPIVSGTALGITKKILKKSGIKAGDSILVTKKLGLEGTSIICDLKKPELNKKEIERLNQISKMLSVVSEGKILKDSKEITSMHDITEGGVLGAVAEICEEQNLGAEIYEKFMPIDGITLKLCKQYKINPLRLISSGSMLITCKSSADVIKVLNENGIECSEIGKITEQKEVRLFKADGSMEIVRIEPDELCFIGGEKI